MLWGQNFFPRNITSSQKRAYITHNFTGKLSLQHVPDSRPRNLSPSQFAYLCVLNLFTLRAWQKMEGSGVENSTFFNIFIVFLQNGPKENSAFWQTAAALKVLNATKDTLSLCISTRLIRSL